MSYGYRLRRGPFAPAPGPDPDSSGAVQVATVTLTDAQIKALPTAEVQIVAAPGEGYAILPILSLLQGDFTEGAYTEIDSSYSMIYVCHAGYSGVFSTLVTMNGGFPTNGGLAYLPLATTLDLVQETETANVSSVAAAENKALVIGADNGSLGNFLSGDAANTLKVTVLYAVVEV